MRRYSLRRIGGVVLAAAAVGLGVGVWQGGIIGGAGGGCNGCTSTATANIWVSSAGSDSGASCVRSSSPIADPSTGGSADCASLSKAYQLANVGDTVGVGCGGGTSCTYGYQTIFWANAKAAGSKCQWGAPFPTDTITQTLSGCVHYLPETGDTPTLSGMTINAPYVWLDSFTSTTRMTLFWDGNHGGGNCDQQKVNNEILSNDTFTGFYIGGGQQIYFVNDNIGPTTDASNDIQPCDPASINNLGAYIHSDHIAIIGGSVHDTTTSNPSGHIEGIHYQDGAYAYIAGVKFTNNDQQDISFHPHGSDHLDHMLIENNIFDRPCSNHGSPCSSINAVSWGCDFGTLQDVTVRFNSYNGGNTFDGTWTGGSTNCQAIQFYGNIQDGPTSCPTTVSGFTVATYSYNVYTNNPGVCGTGNSYNHTLASVYVDQTSPAYNFRETTGAASIDFVTAGTLAGAGLSAPATDLAGITRPQGSAIDDGAYER